MGAKTEHELHQRPSNVGASVQIEPAKLTAIVDEAARVLGLLANSKRLLILCCLVEHDELNVTALASRVGLSQSALSQHLAKLRLGGLVTFRREAQILFYAVNDARVRQLLRSLEEALCSLRSADQAP